MQSQLKFNLDVPIKPKSKTLKSRLPRRWWACKCCGKDCYADNKDYYMLKDEVWEKIFPMNNGMLCMSCAESRLGRKLQKEDILVCRLTTEDNFYTRAILNQ